MKELLLKLLAIDQRYTDRGILFLRLFFGFMMLVLHGWAKLSAFPSLSQHFPDPLGVGSTASLVMIICAEAGCSLLLILGFMTRLATLPLMFGMLMATFAIHGADPFAARELPLLYLAVYIVLLWTGAGRYSLDEIIRRKLIRRATVG